MSGNSQILEQALRSNDSSIMQFVFDKIDEPEIAGLVEGLPAGLIAPFLRTFSQQMERSPSNFGKGLPWVEALIVKRANDISASLECQRRVQELQNTLKQRTQQIGIFTEVCAMTDYVRQEREGSGIGLRVVDTSCQELSE